MVSPCLQGHYRRGIALSALGRHEEALYALCISVAIDKNPQAVRYELTKVHFCRLSGNSAVFKIDKLKLNKE